MKYQFAVWHPDVGTYGFMDFNIAKSLYDSLSGNRRMYSINSKGFMEVIYETKN